MLFVDDAHLVDATSATVLSQLVDAGPRVPRRHRPRRERSSRKFSTPCGSGRGCAASTSPTSTVAVDTLLHLVLHDPVEASTSGQLWAASQGNVLFLRELVLGALQRGQLVRRHGVWRLAGRSSRRNDCTS